MTEILFLIENAPEGGHVARSLGHSIHTQADTCAELQRNARDAVHRHFGDEARPKTIRFRQWHA